MLNHLISHSTNTKQNKRASTEHANRLMSHTTNKKQNKRASTEHDNRLDRICCHKGNTYIVIWDTVIP